MVDQKTTALALIVLTACGSWRRPEEAMAIPRDEGTRGALELVRKGRTRLAIERLESRRALEPRNAWVAFGLGRAYAADSLFGLARKEYARSMALHPDFEPAVFDLAALAYSEKKYDIAAAHLDILAGSNPAANWNRTLLALRHRKLDDARDHIDEVVAARPQWVEGWELKTLIDISRRDWAGARNACERLHTLKPKNQFAVMNLIWLEHRQGRLNELERRVNRLHKMDPTAPDTPAAAIKLIESQFPWKPSQALMFKDWSGRGWLPAGIEPLFGDPTTPNQIKGDLP